MVKTRMMTTRSNTMMAFTTVEDLTGSMELLLFPRVLAECRPVLVDNSVVVVTGRVSVKEDEAAKLIVEQIVPIEEYQPAGAARPRQSEAPMALYLKLPSRECPQMRKVQNLLSIFDGGMQVYMYFADVRQLTLAPRTMWGTGSSAAPQRAGTDPWPGKRGGAGRPCAEKVRSIQNTMAERVLGGQQLC